MGDIFILTENDLRRCVTLDHGHRCGRGGFRVLASGKVVMPPILSMELPDAHGEVDVKTAYIPGFDNFAIKVSPGFFDNPKLGLPSLNGLMILFSAKTGLVKALLLDNGYLTDMRTAAAGAVAAAILRRNVSRPPACSAPACRHGCRSSPRIWCGRSSGAGLGPRQGEGRGLRQGHRRGARRQSGGVTADARCATASSWSPRPRRANRSCAPNGCIRASHHRHGLRPGRQERDRSAGGGARRSLCLRPGHARRRSSANCAPPARRPLSNAVPPELGEIIAGRNPAAALESAITICDLTGTGAQDTAIASHALQAAEGRHRHPSTIS